jgi:hypothetical protein
MLISPRPEDYFLAGFSGFCCQTDPGGDTSLPLPFARAYDQHSPGLSGQEHVGPRSISWPIESTPTHTP